MARYYAKEFVGVRDGSIQPQQCDGRIVDAKKRRTRAVKDNVTNLAVGDQLYIGRVPQGAVVALFSAITDTSFGTSTISIGTLAAPAKYVNAKTLTATDVWTPLGPSAAAAVADPTTAEEEIWATIGVAAIPAAVVAAIATEFTISA